MKSISAPPLSNRVLQINVGFLLSAGSGQYSDVSMEISDPVKISEELTAQEIQGVIRLTRAKEGILAQTDVIVHIERECSRCLDQFVHPVRVKVEELYAHPQPLEETEFFIGQDAKLDLAPLLRAELLIALSQRAFCREDCKGLCATCGINLNHETCDCENEKIDPRMAKLKELLDAGDA